VFVFTTRVHIVFMLFSCAAYCRPSVLAWQAAPYGSDSSK